MRNKRWLRYGILTALVGGTSLGTLLVACGDDDDGVTPNNRVDSGTDTGNNNNPDGSGNPDTGTNPPNEAGVDAGQPAKLIVIHAATDLGPDTVQTGPFAGGVRICFETKTATDTNFSPAPFHALPANEVQGRPYPGLFIGTGGSFTTGGNLPLEVLSIRPYIMNAKKLFDMGFVGEDGGAGRCPSLLRDGGIEAGGGTNGNLEYGKGFWQLADIPAGTLQRNKTYILAVTGCTSNATATTGFCGPDDAGTPYVPTGTPGNGNLKALLVEVDTTSAVAADEIGAAALNLSPQQNAVKAATGDYKPTLHNVDVLDGGGPDADAAAHRFAITPNGAELVYNRNATTPSPIAKIKGLVTESGFYAFAPTGGNLPDPNPLAPRGSQKLNNVGAGGSPATVQALSFGVSDAAAPQVYVNGKGYTFVLVGDPTLDANQGPRRMHGIAFPNQQ